MTKISRPEKDAIFAALTLLAVSLANGEVRPNDGDIGDILTCCGEHAGLTVVEIDDLAQRLMEPEF